MAIDEKRFKDSKRAIAIFMADRVDYAMSTRDKKHCTPEAIEKLLDERLDWILKENS